VKVKNLLQLIERLRDVNGCPWDKAQTSKTMISYMLEEVYELIDAIESGIVDDICEELGDVLFHILFISILYKEAGHFDIFDVIHVNHKKMVRRHPHVFCDSPVDSIEEVKKKWREIKQKEKKSVKQDSIFNSIPLSLPSLIRANKISKRAAQTGFDWDNISDVICKAKEEWVEFQNEIQNNNFKKAYIEFGDVLFTLVNVARFANINPETALKKSTDKFKKRFKFMEKIIAKKGRHIKDVSRDEKEKLWIKAKTEVG